jgi:hypothetical protein
MVYQKWQDRKFTDPAICCVPGGANLPGLFQVHLKVNGIRIIAGSF